MKPARLSSLMSSKKVGKHGLPRTCSYEYRVRGCPEKDQLISVTVSGGFLSEVIER